MSKDFEEEYRQMIDSELPDLWSRIEERLAEETPVEAAGDGTVGNKKLTDGSVSDKKALVTRIFTVRRMAAVMTATAAVICIALVRPTLSEQREMGGANSYAPAPQGEPFFGPASDNYAPADHGGSGNDGNMAVAEAAWDRADTQAEAFEDKMQSIAPSSKQDGVQINAGASNSNKPSASAKSDKKEEEALASPTQVYRVEAKLVRSVAGGPDGIWYEAEVVVGAEGGPAAGSRVICKTQLDSGTQEADRKFLAAVFQAQNNCVLYLQPSGEKVKDYEFKLEKDAVYEPVIYVIRDVADAS